MPFSRAPRKPKNCVITSTPPGARVESNGAAVGTTPLERDYPGGFFHKTKTAVGARLGHPLVARLSLDGCSIKEIVLTEGPAQWISLENLTALARDSQTCTVEFPVAQ